MRLVLPGFLAATSLALIAGIAYEAVAPLDPPKVETARVPTRPRPIVRAADYSPPAEELFSDIDARPLFSASRKPLPDMVQASAAVAATSDFSLVGVIMGGTRAVALLRIKSTASTTSAAVGDTLNGWRVTRIDATTVTLHANGTDFVVPLVGPASQPPSAALPPLAPEPNATAPSQTPPPATTPQAAATPALTSAASAAVPAPTATTGLRPTSSGHPATGTIAPEALRGAPIDPRTGEPTL